MKQKGKQIPPEGEIRQSQILSSFGPGSMVDLPNHSIIIGGLNHWKFGTKVPVVEPRLEQFLQQKLKKAKVALFEPPASNQDPTGPRTGIQSFMFPGWFVAQVDSSFQGPSGKNYRTRPLVPWSTISPLGGKYLDENKKKKPVVPVRFVQACVYGHISDIDWRGYVHKGTQCTGSLWLDEGGTGSDFADIFVRCEACNNRRALSDATLPKSNALGICRGDRPWLGRNARQECGLDENNRRIYNRLLVRSASNAYFAQTQSVISLPSADDDIKKAVGKVYEDYLQYAADVDGIKYERNKPQINQALEGFSNETVWQEVQRRKSGKPSEQKKIKQVEIETLLSQPDEIGEDLPDTDFYARNLSLTDLSASLVPFIDRVVLIHRLREVLAQVSFTRFEPPFSDIDGELQLDVGTAALGLDTDWFPAIEVKGEGVFISFKPAAIERWLTKPAVKHRGQELQKGFRQWLSRRELKLEGTDDKPQYTFPGLPYVMLHTLSHLLITSISLECGYSASAIKERVYAGESGYGILLYTGSSGSEGTLGGLIQIGRKIEHHLKAALESGRLCSNDPVCAQHQPDEPHEERFRHGAACHGCVLISETSCEQGNEFLDRALVVDTVETSGTAFFPTPLGAG